MVDISTPEQVNIRLYSGMQVKMGNIENLHYRLAAMNEILENNISAEATGTLDMRSTDGKWIYRHITEDETQEETAVDDSSENDTAEATENNENNTEEITEIQNNEVEENPNL